MMKHLIGFEKFNESKKENSLKLGDVVFDKKNKSIGIVIGVYDNEVKTDADGNQDPDNLKKITKREIFAKMKTKAKFAPSTIWCLFKMGFFTEKDVDSFNEDITKVSKKTGEGMIKQYKLPVKK